MFVSFHHDLSFDGGGTLESHVWAKPVGPKLENFCEVQTSSLDFLLRRMAPKSSTPSKKSEEALTKLFDSLADPDDPEIIGGKDSLLSLLPSCVIH